MTDTARPSIPPDTGGPPSAVLVTAQDCHFCEDAKTLLDELESLGRLTYTTIDLESPEGAEVLRKVRAPFPPMLFVAGEYVGHGRISRRRLVKKLDQLERGGS